MSGLDMKTIAGASALFFVLSPGILLSVPPANNEDGSKGKILMSGKTSVLSAAVHALVFAGALGLGAYLLKKKSRQSASNMYGNVDGTETMYGKLF
jgi:Protein of unknown function (DUF3339)